MSAKNQNQKPHKAREFCYLDKARRRDAELHDDILEGGDHKAAEAVSRKVAERLGIKRKGKS